MRKNYVIIVGGGSGTRMQSAIPKQFMLLNGLPVLMHTLTAFSQSNTRPTIILVLNNRLKSEWEQLCTKYSFDVPHIIVEGGDTRFHSVQNGLNHIKQLSEPIKPTYIAVHDGVRPLVSKEIIDYGFQQIGRHRALITAVSSKDSVRIKESGDTSRAVDRSTVFLVQTPQFFSAEILFEAYEQTYSDTFTDDASVVEKKGYPIQILPGDTRNIKITFSEDLLFAEVIMKSLAND